MGAPFAAKRGGQCGTVERVCAALARGVDKFSELNLWDISFSPTFHDLLGITHTEMELTFADELNDIALEMKLEGLSGFNWLEGLRLQKELLW